MPPVAAAIALSGLGSLGGLLVASALLLVPERARLRIVPWLVSYAVGTLLGAALLAIMPQVLTDLDPSIAFGVLLAGIITFFVLETLVVWRHCHTHECAVHGVTVPVVLVGDAFHNFVDGAVIGASVMTSTALGISSALAVAAHEIPQEIGDFAILLHAGYSRGKALWLNLLSGASAVVGAVAAALAFEVVPSLAPYFLAFTAASFLYVAMADLMPDLHRGTTGVSALRQILLVLAGILSIVAL